MLGIIIGVASVIAMLAIGEGSKISIEENISSMGSNLIMVFPSGERRGGVSLGSSDSKKLTISDCEKIISQCPSIKSVTPLLQTNGQIISGSSNWPTSLRGANEYYFEITNQGIAKGRSFTSEEIRRSSKVCLIGETVKENIFGENSDPIGEKIRFNKIPFEIIGILESKGQSTFGSDQDDILIVPYTTVQKRILAITSIHQIFTSAISETASEQAVKEIEETLRKAHKLTGSEENDFSIRTQEEIMSMLSSTSQVMTTLLAAIASISLLVGGIGIMNIMYVSVTERTREIGLRSAVGGREQDIMWQFLIESIFMSVTGGIIGIILGISIAFSVSHFMNWPINITVDSIFLAFFFASIIGVFFGWYPARKAAKLDPINALRHE
jgi:putative ABC transport system permease protein